MTEMTRHMMMAMTMPTYSATSSVLGAAGGGQRPNKRILHSIVPKIGIRLNLCLTTSVSSQKTCQTHWTTGSVSCEALQLV